MNSPIYLSNVGSAWSGRIIFLSLIAISFVIFRSIYISQKWIMTPMPIIFLFLAYISTKSNLISYDNHNVMVKNIFRTKIYSRSDVKAVKQGIPLPQYYIIEFDNGDSYNFQRGNAQNRFLTCRDRSTEAKALEKELLSYEH